MLRTRPFCAVHPEAGDASSISSVPYDVVDREEAAALAEGNDASFLHILRPEIGLPGDTSPYDDVVYEAAVANYRRLRSEGLLVRDEEPALYLYRQVMGDHQQVGIVACCHVQDYEQGVIRRHEKTRPDKEDDRTRHVLATNVNAGPVFLAHHDSDAIDAVVANETTARPLFHFVADDSVTHTGWRVVDRDALQSALDGLDVAYVADGHHRSASAARAARERAQSNPDHTGDEEYNWFLSVLFPASQLRIEAYNRIVVDLAGKTPAQVLEEVRSVGSVTTTDDPVPTASGSFCFYLDGAWYRLDLDSATIRRDDPIASLDVDLLQERVLGPILNVGDPRVDERIGFVGGVRGTDELARRVDEGRAAIAFSLLPTTIEQLMDVSDAGLMGPPKFTWFEPKLRSGLFVHELD